MRRGKLKAAQVVEDEDATISRMVGDRPRVQGEATPGVHESHGQRDCARAQGQASRGGVHGTGLARYNAVWHKAIPEADLVLTLVAAKAAKVAADALEGGCRAQDCVRAARKAAEEEKALSGGSVCGCATGA